MRGLGATNAEAFIEAVSRKLDEGDTQSVVIASTLGRTRLKFAKKLHGKIQIIDFSYRKIPPRIKESITGLSMVVMDNAGLPLYRYEADKVRNHYMCWARGSRLPLR